MLSDTRPSASEILKQSFLATAQLIIQGQQPRDSPDRDALLYCLGFLNKSKALLAFNSLIKHHPHNFTFTEEQLIHLVELLVISMVQ